MKTSINTCVLILALSVIAFSNTSWAQSGSRSARGGATARAGGSTGGASRSTGGASRSSGGGSVRSSGSGTRSLGGSGSRLSSAQRAELLLLQQQQAKEFQEQQVEFAKKQRVQFLAQLGNQPNGPANKKQNSLAFEEAKGDYRALRNQTVDPAKLGPLSQPFRLRNDAIDRKKREANWPKFFEDPAYQPLVTKINSKIMENEIVDSESAQEFVGELAKLHQALNAAATNGEVGRTEFARARRFVTGLGNEVRATNLFN